MCQPPRPGRAPPPRVVKPPVTIPLLSSPTLGGEGYTTAGGALKIKGSKIEKKRKKKKKRVIEDDQGVGAIAKRFSKDEAAPSTHDRQEEHEDDGLSPAARNDPATPLDIGAGKTEAERKHEELRRQRVRARWR